jgi:2,4-diaminopentanoate dehydrogenase
MTIKVAAIGTGNVGRHALTQLINDPQYDLTAVWVSSESKAGKDAGELAGLDVSTGISATTDLDAVLADKPGMRGLNRNGLITGKGLYAS